MRISAFAMRRFDFALASRVLISSRRALTIVGSFESDPPTASEGASGIRTGETGTVSVQAAAATTITTLPARRRLRAFMGMPLDTVVRTSGRPGPSTGRHYAEKRSAHMRDDWARREGSRGIVNTF